MIIVVIVLTITALGHTGYRTETTIIHLMPLAEYKAGVSCLIQRCNASTQILNFFIINGLGNIVVFVPFGAALEYVLRKYVPVKAKRAKYIVFIGAGLSLFYEIIQLWIPGRVTATDDVITNTTGTALGMYLVQMLPFKRPLPYTQDTVS